MTEEKNKNTVEEKQDVNKKPSGSKSEAGHVSEQKFDEHKVRLEKMAKLREQGVLSYPRADFKPSISSIQLMEKFHHLNAEEIEKHTASYKYAGRVMMVRDFGKGGFILLADQEGRFQAFISKKDISEQEFFVYKHCDIGDFVGVEGKCFKTRTGDLAIHVEKLHLLSKSLRPLPEKFHGLTDVESRYRQRYIDLIVNPESREVFKKRSQIVSYMRTYLMEKGYLEVETPMMQSIPGGATAKPFITHHNTLGLDLYMRIAPELYLKRLLVGGFEKVFELNRNFRNEGISTFHNPEFTMVEIYIAYATYEYHIDLVEDMVSGIAQKLYGTDTVSYQGNTVSFKRPWDKMSVHDSILKHCSDLSAETLKDKDAIEKHIKAKPYAHMLGKGDKPLGEILMFIFDEEVQPKLINPTFITHYPIEISPLARRFDNDPNITERFELFICGKEVANAFTELNDPIDQKERFMEQAKKKDSGDEEAHHFDEDFINALEHGMPPAAGLGIGIDRLVMILTDSASIRDVILFPVLRPRKDTQE